MNIKQDLIDTNIKNVTNIPSHSTLDTVNNAKTEVVCIKQEITEEMTDVGNYSEVSIKQEELDIKVEDHAKPKPKDGIGNGPSWTENGNKPGTHVYTDRTHYRYIEHSRSLYRRQLRCSKFESGCFGRASMDLEPIGKPIVVLRGHTCTPGINGMADFRSILKSRAQNESTPFEHIWTEECRKNPTIARAASHTKMLDMMRRARRMRQAPEQPQSLKEMGDMLASPAWATRLLYCNASDVPFFRGSLEIQCDEGQTEFVGLAFANYDFWEKNRAWLIAQEETQLVFDGSFEEVLPKLNGLNQLLTMHMIVDNLAIPICFFLLKNKNEETYLRALKYIRYEMPFPIDYNNANITVDFEQGLRNAIISIIPECSPTNGCWMHYNQSIVAWIKTHNLRESMQGNANCRRILRLITAIPHLPAVVTRGFPENFTVRGGLDIVKQLMHYLKLQETFMAFFAYYERFWMEEIGPERITVFGKELTTSNFSESYHAHLLRLMGLDSPIWTFYERLRDMEKRMRDDASKMLNGEVLRRRSISCKNGNRKIISSALGEVRDNSLATYGFLLKVSHCADAYLEDVFGKINDGGDNLFTEQDEPFQQAAIACFFNEKMPKQRRGSDRIKSKGGRRGRRAEEEPDDDEEPAAEETSHKRARGGRCTVCLGQEATMAVIPCGHLCICQPCSTRLLQSDNVICPVCRTAGDSIIRIYINI